MAPVSRRTAVRTLAWTAPVVVVASAAPAHAASGDAVLMVVPGQPVRSLDPGTLTRTSLLAPATVTNTGSFATTALQVVLRVTPSVSSIDLGPSTASTVAGFAAPTRTSNGSQVFFTYVATQQLAAGGALTFTPTVTLAAETDGAVNFAASPGNGATATGGIPFQ